MESKLPLRKLGNALASAAGKVLLAGATVAFAGLAYGDEPVELQEATITASPQMLAMAETAGAAENEPRRARRARRDRVERERETVEDPNRVKPWTQPMDLGPPVPDRWRIMEAFYDENLLDPYNNNNPLKGDKPIIGEDWFFSILGISDTIIEPRKFPVPVGVSTTASPNELNTIGNQRVNLFIQQFITEFVLLKGDTAFKPPDWEFRFTPVINFNYARSRERGVLKIDPTEGGHNGRTRNEQHFAVQAAFVDKHLRNTSDRYDFDSLRFGIQPFNSDFRGFLFQDNQLGVRLFGIRDNNRFQYNLAWFRRLEKDTNTALNSFKEPLRNDDVFIANVYWQDLPLKGIQTQFTTIYNRNREKDDLQFDDNGFIARPASLFEERGKEYDVVYFGYNTDGRIGRMNLTGSFYYAFGEQTNEKFQSEESKIRSWFFAAELSRDFDWIRPRLSILFASGDDDAFDDEANGFDAIFENPQFAGADTSYMIRQPVPLVGGGLVSLSGRNGILNSLRSTKELGQSNFTNPGTRLIGVGADFDIMPHLRVSVNANQLWFDKTDVLEQARQQGDIDENIGQDVSVSVIFRPLVTQNVVFRLSGALLVPGDGWRSLYGNNEDLPYSVLANITLQY